MSTLRLTSCLLFVVALALGAFLENRGSASAVQLSEGGQAQSATEPSPSAQSATEPSPSATAEEGKTCIVTQRYEDWSGGAPTPEAALSKATEWSARVAATNDRVVDERTSSGEEAAVEDDSGMRARNASYTSERLTQHAASERVEVALADAFGEVSRGARLPASFRIVSDDGSVATELVAQQPIAAYSSDVVKGVAVWEVVSMEVIVPSDMCESAVDILDSAKQG